MRQLLGRALFFLIVILVIFGIYRLLTVKPLEPVAFFAGQGVLLLADTSQTSQVPPDTVVAFQAAQDAGAGGLFLTLRAARDGELVVLGNTDLASFSEASGSASDLTLAELSRLDAGYRLDPDGDGSFPWRGQGLHILTAQEVLDSFPDLQIIFNLAQPDTGAVDRLRQLAEDTGAWNRLLVVVDDQDLAKNLRSQVPQLATAYTNSERQAFLATYGLRLTPFYRPAAPALIVDGDQASPGLVQAAHSRGVHVVAHGGSDAELFGQLRDAGVDAIIVAQ